MPTKDMEKQKLYRRRWYERNKAHAKAKVIERKQSLQKWLYTYKEARACSCGEDTPVCLDFHHVDPSTKLMEVSLMPNLGYSIKRILEEIAKCDLMCANCHRKLHAGLI